MSRSNRFKEKETSKKKEHIINFHICACLDRSKCTGELILGLDDEYFWTTDKNKISPKYVNYFKPRKVHKDEENAKKCTQSQII